MKEYIDPMLLPLVKVPPLNLRPYDFHSHYFSEMLSKYPNQIERYKHFMTLHSVAKVVEIDERLVPLIEGTDNEIFYRPLFFKSVFINSDFKVSIPTGMDRLWWVYVVKGIGLIDLGDDWAILVLMTDPQNNNLIKSTLWLLKESEFIYRGGMTVQTHTTLKHHIRMMACNIVDLVECNDNDLEVVTIEPTQRQQEKRELRNKSILPTKVFIRPKKQIMKYINNFNRSPNTRLPPRVMVRGHWRRYKDERYSEKLRQKPQWIKPFYKGVGFIKQSTYKVVP